MRTVLFFLFSLSMLLSIGQQTGFKVHELSLPKGSAIEFYNNQFSGLFVHDGKLFMLSESRLQESLEGVLYAINLTDLDRKIEDTSYTLPFKKYKLYDLEKLKIKMDAAGQKFEGLEAIIIDKNEVYISVETPTPATLCYLIKGRLTDTSVVMDANFLMPIAKPVATNGSHIYNAGFEAIAKNKDSIFTFFEYNYFPSKNNVYLFKSKQLSSKSKRISLTVSKLPFRITDITPTSLNHYTAINYFYNGDGDDTVYRMPATDTANNRLIKTNTGYKSYTRLIDVERTKTGFTWKPLWEFPDAYMSYNWEGIAAYKQGYFIINDKYTPKRPYYSVLLYLEKLP